MGSWLNKASHESIYDHQTSLTAMADRRLRFHNAKLKEREQIGKARAIPNSQRLGQILSNIERKHRLRVVPKNRIRKLRQNKGYITQSELAQYVDYDTTGYLKRFKGALPDAKS